MSPQLTPELTPCQRRPCALHTHVLRLRWLGRTGKRPERGRQSLPLNRVTCGNAPRLPVPLGGHAPPTVCRRVTAATFIVRLLTLTHPSPAGYAAVAYLHSPLPPSPLGCLVDARTKAESHVYILPCSHRDGTWVLTSQQESCPVCPSCTRVGTCHQARVSEDAARCS